MPRKKKHAQRRGRPSVLTTLPIAKLVAEIDRRRTLLGRLQQQRADLQTRLNDLDCEIAQLGPADSADTSSSQPGRNGRRRGRRRSADSLSSLLQSILRGKTMTVAEMAEAAKKTGYKSKSKNFRVIVSLTLLKNRKLFKRVARGQYTAK